MNTADLSLSELCAMLHDTERGAGPDTQAAQILRRIVAKREQMNEDTIALLDQLAEACRNVLTAIEQHGLHMGEVEFDVLPNRPVYRELRAALQAWGRARIKRTKPRCG